jgi:hypothetical protein
MYQPIWLAKRCSAPQPRSVTAFIAARMLRASHASCMHHTRTPRVVQDVTFDYDFTGRILKDKEMDIFTHRHCRCTAHHRNRIMACHVVVLHQSNQCLLKTRLPAKIIDFIHLYMYTGWSYIQSCSWGRESLSILVPMGLDRTGYWPTPHSQGVGPFSDLNPY